MADAFRSARLVYRAVGDNDEDIGFLSSLNQESEGRIKNSSALFKPVNKNFAQQQAKRFEQSFISVLICLPNSSRDDQSNSTSEDLKPIGRISLWRIEEGKRHHRNTNIDIHILAAYQRKGYGSEAINWILKWAFQIAGLHRVGIYYYSYNLGVKEFYERLGFVLEGRMRESVWYDGRWYDEIVLGMLKSEWKARNEKLTGEIENIKISTANW